MITILKFDGNVKVKAPDNWKIEVTCESITITDTYETTRLHQMLRNIKDGLYEYEGGEVVTYISSDMIRKIRLVMEMLG